MFAPEDFPTLARRLLTHDCDEATLRTVISRAYYSAFLGLRARRQIRGASHKEFWTAIEDTDPALGESQRFRYLRNAADYGDAVPDLEEQ